MPALTGFPLLRYQRHLISAWKSVFHPLIREANAGSCVVLDCSSVAKSGWVKPRQTKKSNWDQAWNQTEIRPGKPILTLFNPKICPPLHGKAIHCFTDKSHFVNTCPSSICLCPIKKLTRVSRCSSTSRKAKQGKLTQKNSPFFSGHFDGKTLGNPAKTVQKTVQIHSKNTRNLMCFIFCNSQLLAAPKPLGEGGSTHPALNLVAAVRFQLSVFCFSGFN